MANKPYSKRARVKARRNAVQALYQWHMSGTDMSRVIEHFKDGRDAIKKADLDYFEQLLRGVNQHHQLVEQSYTDLLDRPLKEIDPVERSILDLGVYELLYHPELPWRVVINEYVELAKLFGAEDSHKYINTIIDQAAKTIRASEIKAVSR